MKQLTCMLSFAILAGCGSSSAAEEKDRATRSFIDCNFADAIATAELALEHADGDVEESFAAGPVDASDASIQLR